jgi:hypothetical protein
MFLNWNEYRSNLLATIGKFAQTAARVYERLSEDG